MCWFDLYCIVCAQFMVCTVVNLQILYIIKVCHNGLCRSVTNYDKKYIYSSNHYHFAIQLLCYITASIESTC